MDPEGFEPSPNTLMGYRATVTPRAHAESLSPHGALAMAPCENLSCRVSFRDAGSAIQKCKRPRKSRGRSREPINRYPVKVTLIIETTPPQIKLLAGEPAAKHQSRSRCANSLNPYPGSRNGAIFRSILEIETRLPFAALEFRKKAQGEMYELGETPGRLPHRYRPRSYHPQPGGVRPGTNLHHPG